MITHLLYKTSPEKLSAVAEQRKGGGHMKEKNQNKEQNTNQNQEQNQNTNQR